MAKAQQGDRLDLGKPVVLGLAYPLDRDLRTRWERCVSWSFTQMIIAVEYALDTPKVPIRRSLATYP